MRIFLGVLLCAFLVAAAGAQDLRPWAGGATPPLTLRDLEGRPHRLEDYRGKVILVNFWATWCEPCREEMPSIRKLRQSLAGEPFMVLAVNLAEPESRIKHYLEKVPLDFPVLLDRDTAVAKAWGARILPATFIVGPDGLIHFSHTGELDWSKDSVRKRIVATLRR